MTWSRLRFYQWWVRDLWAYKAHKLNGDVHWYVSWLYYVLFPIEAMTKDERDRGI